MTDFRAAFPDLNFWGTEDFIAEGDYVVRQWEGAPLRRPKRASLTRLPLGEKSVRNGLAAGGNRIRTVGPGVRNVPPEADTGFCAGP
jgi:hypothetical protein